LERTVIRVLVQLVPGGDERRTRELGRAELGNLSAAGPSIFSSYSIAAHECSNPLAGTGPWECRGKIENHDRRESVWTLVERAAAWAARQAEVRGNG
jgi:hypothetical protein